MSASDLLRLPWIPTTEGAASLADVVQAPQQYAALMSGAALTDAALLRLLLLTRARGMPRLERAPGLDLYSQAAPFMQAPPTLTASLPDSPIHGLDLLQASGRDVTLLTHTFDAAPVAVSAAEAARRLVTFHAFAPSRGITRFHPSKDSPHARTVHFHAAGESLQQTLDLNTPPGLGDGPPPTWEAAPDWRRWKDAASERLTLSNLHAHPWRSVTLRPDADGSVRVMAQASGVVPTPPADAAWPDPHAHHEAIPEDQQKKRGGPFDRARNPQSREVHGALVRTLKATLQGDPLTPHSFRAALTHGAARVSAVGLITRSGQPVALNVSEAGLPWPTLSAADASDALTAAERGAGRVLEAVYAVLKPGGINMQAVRTGTWTQFYWHLIWPALSMRLSGQITADDFRAATEARALDAALHASTDKNALIRHIILKPDEASA